MRIESVYNPVLCRPVFTIGEPFTKKARCDRLEIEQNRYKILMKRSSPVSTALHATFVLGRKT